MFCKKKISHFSNINITQT